MTRQTTIMTCTYVIKGAGADFHRADVRANNVDEATAILSKAHGKKGCAVILAYTKRKGLYRMDDDFFFSNAELVSITDEEESDIH